uniref:Uncharacterized protein n=1 Tax=Rhizophora mucronata TaxID=61149 RepID=A0A2P2K9M9_RHIMU
MLTHLELLLFRRRSQIQIRNTNLRRQRD